VQTTILNLTFFTKVIKLTSLSTICRLQESLWLR